MKGRVNHPHLNPPPSRGRMDKVTLWQGGCPTISTEFIITAVKEIDFLRGGNKTGIH
jgi:hypothetical protein